MELNLTMFLDLFMGSLNCTLDSGYVYPLAGVLFCSALVHLLFKWKRG